MKEENRRKPKKTSIFNVPSMYAFMITLIALEKKYTPDLELKRSAYTLLVLACSFPIHYA